MTDGERRHRKEALINAINTGIYYRRDIYTIKFFQQWKENVCRMKNGAAEKIQSIWRMYKAKHNFIIGQILAQMISAFNRIYVKRRARNFFLILLLNTKCREPKSGRVVSAQKDLDFEPNTPNSAPNLENPNKSANPHNLFAPDYILPNTQEYYRNCLEFDDEEEGKEVFLNIPKGRVNCPSPSTPHLPSLEEDIRKANRDLKRRKTWLTQRPNILLNEPLIDQRRGTTLKPFDMQTELSQYRKDKMKNFQFKAKNFRPEVEADLVRWRNNLCTNSKYKRMHLSTVLIKIQKIYCLKRSFYILKQPLEVVKSINKLRIIWEKVQLRDSLYKLIKEKKYFKSQHSLEDVIAWEEIVRLNTTPAESEASHGERDSNINNIYSTGQRWWRLNAFQYITAMDKEDSFSSLDQQLLLEELARYMLSLKSVRIIQRFYKRRLMSHWINLHHTTNSINAIVQIDTTFRSITSDNRCTIFQLGSKSDLDQLMKIYNNRSLGQTHTISQQLSLLLDSLFNI